MLTNNAVICIIKEPKFGPMNSLAMCYFHLSIRKQFISLDRQQRLMGKLEILSQFHTTYSFRYMWNLCPELLIEPWRIWYSWNMLIIGDSVENLGGWMHYTTYTLNVSSWISAFLMFADGFPEEMQPEWDVRSTGKWQRKNAVRYQVHSVTKKRRMKGKT